MRWINGGRDELEKLTEGKICFDFGSMATQGSNFKFPLNILSSLEQNKNDDKRADERSGRNSFQHFCT
jgi:hypothetical protein